jgi:hypothetical protein
MFRNSYAIFPFPSSYMKEQLFYKGKLIYSWNYTTEL